MIINKRELILHAHTTVLHEMMNEEYCVPISDESQSLVLCPISLTCALVTQFI